MEIVFYTDNYFQRPSPCNDWNSWW